MTSFFTAVSALQASQNALDVIGNNIANSNSPGFHRQIATLSGRTPLVLGQLSFGRGVDVLEIRRSRSEVIEAALTRNVSEQSDLDSLLTGMFRAESRIAAETGSVGSLLEGLFNDLEQLSTKLSDQSVRSVVLNSASALTNELNSLSDEFSRTLASLRLEIRDAVRELNSLTSRVAGLNEDIQRVENRGSDANDLRDQRDLLINQIADLVNVELVEQEPGTLSVFSSGAPLVVVNRSLDVELEFGADGRATISVTETQTELNLTGGRLSGLLRLQGDVIPGLVDQLNLLSSELIGSFDAIQSTGFGIDGPLTQVISQRAVDDVNVPLEQAGLAFPPQAGSLFVGVTNLQTGVRTISEVAVDPSAQQLNSLFPAAAPDPTLSLADAISAVAGVQALVNDQTGTITLRADNGFGFDFAGGFETLPNTTAFTAPTTTVPTLGGVYGGPDNDLFTFTFTGPVGTATIGVTPGLELEVRDQTNNVIAVLEVGQNYSPGSPIDVADGLTIRLSAGNAVVGESFSSQVIGQPDTGGVLTALGLNTFFVGNDARSISVNSRLIEDPNRIATSLSGQPGDELNLERFVALRDSLTMVGGTQSFLEFTTSIVTELAVEVRSLSNLQETSQLLGFRLEAERQGISGVDPNEELVDMIRFQRQFEAAARYIAAVNESLDSLFQIV